MRRLLTMELRKAFANPYFAIALGIGLFLCCAEAVDMMRSDSFSEYLEEIASGENDIFISPASYSCFIAWMSVGGDSLWCFMFYRIAPLLAVVPYGWSLASERGNGYVGQIYTRTNRIRYLAAKAFAAFAAGGTVTVVPQLVNLALVATDCPALVPEVFDALTTGVFHDNLWASWFYEVPGLYVAAYCMLDFVLCGVWAAFVTLLGCLTVNRVAVLTVPYVAIYGMQFLNERIFLALGGIRGFQLSLFENLRAYTTQYVQNGWIIAGEILLLAAACLLLTRVGCRRDEQ